MNYESPSIEMMGQMEELTGSVGTAWPFADVTNFCPDISTRKAYDPVTGKWYEQEYCE